MFKFIEKYFRYDETLQQRGSTPTARRASRYLITSFILEAVLSFYYHKHPSLPLLLGLLGVTAAGAAASYYFGFIKQETSQPIGGGHMRTFFGVRAKHAAIINGIWILGFAAYVLLIS
jgi:hypothetical protein